MSHRIEVNRRTTNIEFCNVEILNAITRGDDKAIVMWTRKLCRYIFGMHGMALFLRGNKA